MAEIFPRLCAVEWLPISTFASELKKLWLKRVGIKKSSFYQHHLILFKIMGLQGLQAIFPPLRYCTDNGVMIAWAGHERYALGVRDVVENARYQPRWSLDTLTPVNFNRTNVI
jgi:hypothetical protein